MTIATRLGNGALGQQPHNQTNQEAAEKRILSEDQKERIGGMVAAAPSTRGAVIKFLRESGNDFDLDEYLPIDWGAERRTFTGRAAEMASLGAYEPPNEPTAGDVSIFGHEVQPSGIAGDVAGSLPIMALGYGGGGLAAARMGLTGAAKKGVQYALGETVPGFIMGMFQSDGDVVAGAKMAALFTAGGVIGDVAFAAAGRGFRKMKAQAAGTLQAAPGTLLTKAETLAMREVRDGLEKKLGRPIGPDESMESLAAELELLNLSPSELASATKSAEELLAGQQVELRLVPDDVAADIRDRTGAVMANIQGAEVPEGMLQSLSEQTRSVVDASQMTPVMKQEVSAGIDEINQGTALLITRGEITSDDAARAIHKVLIGESPLDEMVDVVTTASQKANRAVAADIGRLASPELPLPNLRVGTYYDVFLDGKQATRARILGVADNGTVTVDIDGKTTYTTVKALSGVKESADQAVGASHATPPEWRADDTPRGFAAADGPPGAARGPAEKPRSGSRLDDERPPTQQQIDRIHGLEAKMQDEGVKLTTDLKPAAVTMRGLRNYEVELKAQWNSYNNAQMQLATDKLIQEGIDPATMAERLSGYGLSEADQASRISVSGASKERDIGLMGRMGIIPPYSRYGISRNGAAKASVEGSLHMMENIGRDKAEYLNRLRTAMKPLATSVGTKVKGLLGSGTAKDAIEDVVTKKAILREALDGDINALRDYEELLPIYNEIRTITDELARNINLPVKNRITDYFPHIFEGTSGEWRAWRVMDQLGASGEFLEKHVGEKQIPKQRQLARKLKREGGEGYSEDLESVLYAYISGATEYPHMDKFLRESANTVERIPTHDARGKALYIRESYSDWSRYVAGMPSPWKESVSRWWRENTTFNKWVDNAVEYLGDADTKGLMAKVRKGQIGEDGARVGYTAGEEAAAIDFYKDLVDSANRYTREGILKKDVGMTPYRAKLAMTIDDIRADLSNPAARPLIIEKLYGLMVVSKLGASASHFIINMTQMGTNVYPKLGLKNTTRGIKRFLSDRSYKFKSGKTVDEVLEASGVMSDTPEALEFMGGSLGLLADFEAMIMKPASVSEGFNRGATLLARYEQKLGEGLTHYHALASAREMVTKTHFPFNRAGTPGVMHNPMSRFLLMFKSYSMHQMNFSAEMLEDAIRGKPDEFMRHVIAYLTLFGAGATVLSGTSFGEKAAHPVSDLSPEHIRTWGLGKTLGGPTASSFIDALSGQYKQAMQDWTEPVAVKRAGRAAKADNAVDAMLQLTGFNK